MRGDRVSFVDEPYWLVRIRSWKRVRPVVLRRSGVTVSGIVTTSRVLVAYSALFEVRPPPWRRKKTRVLFLPGMKFVPVMVSFWPTFAFIGLTDLMVGALLFRTVALCTLGCGCRRRTRAPASAARPTTRLATSVRAITARRDIEARYRRVLSWT